MTSTQSFFGSRWVEVPGNVTEIAGGLPRGFRAAGVACGIKPSGGSDLGLLVSSAPATTSAARFTNSGTQSAPVLLCRERVDLTGIRAVVVNSGNANAATGRPGFENAAKMQGAAALASRCPEGAVAVASTGVIGVPLPISSVMTGIVRATHALGPEGEVDFARAIRTTDILDKHACIDVAVSGGTVRLTAQAKGAGMISPNFATLLCFIQTDAGLSPETCDLLLAVTVQRSFERISVDGQLSTSDTVILQASGESGVTIEPETEDEVQFGEALDAVLRQLALNMVRDGEGARRVGRVVVRGGDAAAVSNVARAVADSPLVKTARPTRRAPSPSRTMFSANCGSTARAPRRSAARLRAPSQPRTRHWPGITVTPTTAGRRAGSHSNDRLTVPPEEEVAGSGATRIALHITAASPSSDGHARALRLRRTPSVPRDRHVEHACL